MLDGLLEYLVTEMAMDGEEGCSVARLDGFIETYHSRRLVQHPSEPPQLLDSFYKNFVWKKLCELDQVRLGVVEIPSKPTREIQQSGDTDRQEKDDSPMVDESVGEEPTGHHPLELPTVVSNASNHMTQRKTRPSLSASRRNLNERRSNSSQPSGTPALSIGQQRAIETGKVPKNRLVDKKQNETSKKKVKEIKPTASLISREWRELDANDTRGLGRGELLALYGSDEDGERRLRIAVDPMSCWRAVVGTDIRSPKLTPYVYQVLCIVAQGREAGATVIELGRRLKHDQKSLFHFVKVLTDMGLVTKFRAYQHKSWTNRVVHKRYLATSEWYKDFLKTDNPAKTTSSSSSLPTTGFNLFLDDPFNPANLNSNDQFGGFGFETQFPGTSPSTAAQLATPAQKIKNLVDSKTDGQSEETQDHPPLSPITKEHLAVNEPLIRSRICTVLRRSAHHTMVHADIIKAIGIAVPTKDERRRLNRQIDAYIKRGFLEKVVILNVAGNSPCIRLTATGLSSMDDTAVKQVAPTPEDPSPEELEGELCALPLTRSIGQTIYGLVAEAGEDGIIYKDLCRKLNDLELRTAEQILTRMERDHPPSHLVDLKITSVLETCGREKRVRWFSADALRNRCQATAIALPDDLEKEPVGNAGDFMEIHPVPVAQYFYEKVEDLYGMIVIEPKGVWGNRAKRPAGEPLITGRPRKYPKGITAAERKSLREKEVAGLDVTEERDALATKYAQHDTAQTSAPAHKSEKAPARRASQPVPVKRTRRSKANTITVPVESNDHDEEEKLKVAPASVRNRKKQKSTEQPAINQPECDDSQAVVTEAAAPTELTQPCISQPTITATSSEMVGLSSRNRQNLTTLNREQQLLEAIRYAGGIAEKTQDLAKAVRDLAGPGQQVSAANPMDSRTLNTTLWALQTRGEIKVTTVMVPDAIGTPVRRSVVYLASIALDSPEMINWLEDLRTRDNILQDKPSNVPTRKPNVGDGPLPTNNAARRELRRTLAEASEEALHAMFKTQWRCVAQLYGYQMGRVARARSLHLFLLKSFEQNYQESTSNLLFNGHCRIFACGFLFQDLPLEVFIQIVPIMPQSDEFEAYRTTPGAMQKPMSQVPLNIRRMLKIAHQSSRRKVYQAVEVLVHLRVLIPLRKSTEPTDFFRSVSNVEKIYYQPCQMNMTVGLFSLANEALIHKLSQSPPTPPPLLAKWPLKNVDDGNWFWAELHRASLPDPEAPPLQQTFESSNEADQFSASSDSHTLLQLLTDQSKWHSDVQLTWSQREQAIRLNHKHKDPPLDLDNDTEEVNRLARILCTTPEAFINVIKASRDLAGKRKAKKKLRKKESDSDAENDKLRDEAAIKLAQEEAARVLAAKAKNVAQQKEDDYNSIINRFQVRSGIEKIDEDLHKTLHILFTTPTRGINATQLESELALWLKRREEKKDDESDVVASNNANRPKAPQKPGQLPLLPSVQAKLLKVKKIKVAPKRHYDRGTLHKFPERPLRWSAIAARAIRPQPQVEVGLRPPTTITVPGKRTRLEWTDTLDEFLRDLTVILRVRAYATCASLWPWSIATNVFKGTKQSILKNRIRKLERDKSDKIYMDLLTDTWSQLYFEKRGKVPELLDPSPSMPAALDGGLALDYLRANIDKEYLRSQVNVQGEEDVPSEVPLPDTLEEFDKLYQIKQPSKPSERWDQVHISANNVIREDTILSEAFSMSTEYSNDSVPPRPSRRIMRACEAIKLLTSTPIETYSEPVATRLLSQYGENILIAATKYLHSMGMITFGSKVHYRKRLPGRSYCYSDKLICPPDNRVVQPKLDEAIDRLRSQCDNSSDAKVQWSLFATDTETAALLHAFSEDRVSLEIDVSVNRQKRWKAASLYRTRQLGDDALENNVNVIFRPPISRQKPFVRASSPSEEFVELVKSKVQEAGIDGIKPLDLVYDLSNRMNREEIGETVEYMTKTEPPKLYWVNEHENLIISSDYLIDWGEKTKPGFKEIHLAYMIPRLWYDIYGEKVEEIWNNCLDRIESIIHNFPGLSINELDRLTKMHFNSLERYDVLEELILKGRISNSPPGKTHYKRWIRGFSDDRFWSVL
ncbi:hypothetical protein DFH28DRAFT_1079298 [Melampsora americana]|nr:hypothetical protein DFH28DRAFT_1079298 [Melampsora americana]